MRLALVALLLLAGCGAAPRTPAPQRPAPTPAPIHSRTVHFRASDGRRLHGTLTPAGPRAPAVILVHGLYGEPAQWRPFVRVLHDAGFTTLAYASRSDHEPDEGVLQRDVAGAVRALRPRRVALVGASVGGSTVAFVLGTRPDLPIRGGVALSPLEGPREIALGRRHAFRPHDLLMVTDQREAQSSRALAADAHGRGVTIYATESDGHGIELLDDAGARARVLAWLKRLLSP